MLRLIAAATACLVLVSVSAAAQSTRVTGTLAYRERVALTPSSIVEITLEDVSRADAPAIVVATARIDHPSQVPIPFDLPYDAARIEANHRYAVRARILDGDRLWFTTTSTVLVITQGHGQNVSLTLTGVSTPPPAAPPAPIARGVAPLPPAVALRNLPATFTGTLPCADCPGIRYQLNLFADDSFFSRMTYLDRPTSRTQDDIGSWVLSSDRRVLVLKGAGDALELFAIRDDLTIRKLDGDGREIVSRGSYDLRRAGSLQALDVRLPMRGSYRSVGGVSEFTECSTGQRWPVASDGARTDLDAVYIAATSGKAGQSVLVMINGRLGGSSASAPSLVIERVTRPLPGQTCAPRFVAAPLTSTYWRLVRLGETPVAVVPGPRNEPSLTFRDDPKSFSGSGGCNRLAGDYTITGDGISLDAVGTLMACVGGTDTETRFRSALGAARRFRILGNTLELFDANRRPLARFEARETN